MSILKNIGLRLSLALIGISIMSLGMINCNSASALTASTNFPDNNFYDCIAHEYVDENGLSITWNPGDPIPAFNDAELATVQNLDCNSKDINDTTGVSTLIGLKDLILDDNKITDIDLTYNTELINLSLDDNQLTSIDLSKNTALTTVSIADNNLTTIDLSNNPSLTILDMGNNQMCNLDTSGNSLLTSGNTTWNQWSGCPIAPAAVVTTPVITPAVPNTAIKSLSFSSPTIVAILGLLSASSIIIAAKFRSQSK